MIEKYTGFRASTGKVFSDEFSAWKEELRAWIKTNGADNDAIASKIVQAIDDGRPESLSTLLTIVKGLQSTAPAVALPAPDDLEVGKILAAYDNLGEEEPFFDVLDRRPTNCRERLKDEGKPYPRSGCQINGCAGVFGACLYNPRSEA